MSREPMQSPNGARRIAMLVDGDNAQPALMGQALAATAKYGDVITRRVYGNWTASGKSAWKAAANANAMLPVQQFAYVKGKNATDMALIIEAMDLLHSGKVNGFCIVSSDSDYTRLAIRISDEGMFVMGIGRENTPESFRNACAVFVTTESLASEKAKTEKGKAGKGKAAAPTTPKGSAQEAAAKTDDSWVSIVEQALQKAKKAVDGRVHLGAVGIYARQVDTAFDPKKYKPSKLGDLIRTRSDKFEVTGSEGSIYVKAK